MNAEMTWSAASVGVAVLALLVTAFLLNRQVRQMEHERNALAIMEAIDRITHEEVVAIFARLSGINERYPTDDDIRTRYPGSQDDLDISRVMTYIETLACLARRDVLDASLLVDAAGLLIRRRWAALREFVYRRRRIEDNEFILENFEWLARYSAWWKDIPRPPRQRNYDPKQFAGVEFKA